MLEKFRTSHVVPQNYVKRNTEAILPRTARNLISGGSEVGCLWRPEKLLRRHYLPRLIPDSSVPFVHDDPVSLPDTTKLTMPCSQQEHFLLIFLSLFRFIFIFDDDCLVGESRTGPFWSSKVHCCPWHRRRLHSRFRCTLRTPLFSVSFRSSFCLSLSLCVLFCKIAGRNLPGG